jgi:tetratricopeptide (TPR) repeat protein
MVASWTRAVRGVLWRAVTRDDGRLRTLGQLWRLIRGIWLTAALSEAPGPPGTAAVAARQALALLGAAGGGHGVERVARISLVTALRTLGREDEAASEARWLTPTPDAPGAGWTWIASRYLQAGRLPAAERAIERAMAEAGLGPARPAALGLLALLHEARGQHLRALGVAGDGLAGTGAAEARGDVAATLHAVRARALVGVARFDDGLAALDEAVAVQPSLGPWMAADRAEALAATGRTDEALAVLGAAVEAGDEGDAALRNRLVLARLLDDLGRAERVAEVLSEAVGPAAAAGVAVHLAVAVRLADARLAVGDAEGAAEAVLDALQAVDEGERGAPADPMDGRGFVAPVPLPVEPPPPELVVAGWRTLGAALTETGDTDGARVALQTALGLCHADLLRRGPDAIDERVEAAIADELRGLLRVDPMVH